MEDLGVYKKRIVWVLDRQTYRVIEQEVMSDGTEKTLYVHIYNRKIRWKKQVCTVGKSIFFDTDSMWLVAEKRLRNEIKAMRAAGIYGKCMFYNERLQRSFDLHGKWWWMYFEEMGDMM